MKKIRDMFLIVLIMSWLSFSAIMIISGETIYFHLSSLFFIVLLSYVNIFYETK